MSTPSVLEREREFFDREACQLTETDLRIPDDQIARYLRARPSTRNIPKDTFFALAAPLRGKRVLDYGCGHGENACLLAACGADVTAFDLSPEAIAQARRRAHLHGVAGRIQFDVRAAGATGYAPGSFDVVLGYKILHHLHTMLDTVYEETARVLAPGGAAYFIEPVANSPLLRTLRRLAPVSCYATEDERQMVYQDFEPLQRHFAAYEVRHFYCLERLRRLLGEWVRVPLRRLDHWALEYCPALGRYYGEVLVIAQPKPALPEVQPATELACACASVAQ
jgi:2-polyprenyl-3-methyl-5-hydroxy-6-metoxy-1,4-benzoquinol methylase